jgi:hypothetical protein
MLIVLRKDLSGLLGALATVVDLPALILVAELESGDLLSVGLGLEGVRSLEGETALEDSADVGRLFLDFGIGNWGAAPSGGPEAVLDGCGNVDIELTRIGQTINSQSRNRPA